MTYSRLKKKKKPCGQSVQLEAAAVATKLPELHAEQLVEPSDAEKNPAVQFEHEVTPSALIVPARQFEQTDDPVLLLYFPDTQLSQIVEAVIGAFLPESHFSQELCPVAP